MNLRDPKLWITVVSLLCVAGLVLLASERTSPGPLSAAHAQHPELAAAQGCAVCHGGFGLFGGGQAASCLECHEEIDAQLARASGLHGTLGAERARECADCHGEHLGTALELAGPRAFALAGFERDEFDHTHVEFALTGVHTAASCEACHSEAETEVLPLDTPRFLGLEQACESCHDDPHEGTFARGCATCHGQQEPFAALASFEHGAAFPLVGAHAGPSCAECHEPASARSIEVMAGLGPLPPARTCAACHDDPHAPAFIAQVAELDALGAGATCALCHDTERGSFEDASAADTLRARAELHTGSGFELALPHDAAACDACHGEALGTRFEERYPGREASSCEACHDDPHGGQFAGRSGCSECHAGPGASGASATFVPSAFGVDEHARTALPLADSHAQLECAVCHLPAGTASPAPVQFAGTPARCEDCHADVHEPAFPQAELAGGGCATCHQPTSFDDVVQADFEHGRWTDFELDGAHARAECATCHPAALQPDGRGRSFGRARAAFAFGPGLPACADCHDDAHAGAFVEASGPGVGLAALPEDCAACHTTAAFSEVATFEHGARTGMPLTGAHARADCSACHGSGPEGRRLGRVGDHYPGPAERCGTCHTDPHAGAFDGSGRPSEIDGREGCARCHGTEAFALFDPAGSGMRGASASFDHGLWTDYELAGAHARAACTDCHPRLLTPDARGRRLAPAPGQACASCHADPHLGQLARAPASDCARCHRSFERFADLTFDHDRDTGFTLDESHAALDCAACHVPWPLPDGREVVRYKPLGTRCIDCHDHGGRHGEQR